MKKKSPRGIPDFGSKGPKSLKSMPQPVKDQPLNQPKPNVTVNVKPASSTSKAGGRRGG